jgi:cobalt/nickel transport system permease protein
MAHIPDGVLAAPVLIGGGLLAAGLVAVGVRRLGEAQIPQTAVLAAAFFVASLVHIPVGPTSVHPLLNGLMGLVLGWAAAPAIFVGLLLQAAFFGFGGLTVLGVNTCNIALPALAVGLLLAPRLRRRPDRRHALLCGAAAGLLGAGLTALLVCASLALSGPEYRPALGIVLASYGPLAVVEAAVTAAATVLLCQLRPAMIGIGARAHG